MPFTVKSILSQSRNSSQIVKEPESTVHHLLTSILSSLSTQEMNAPNLSSLPHNASIDTEAAICPIDHILALINQTNSASIPAYQGPPTDEIVAPMAPLNLNYVSMLTFLMAQQNSIQTPQQRGLKRKHQSINPVSPFSSSLGNDNSQALVIPTPELPQFSAVVQGEQRRKSPVSHSNSVCSNCGTRVTTNWRRSVEGEIECNSCNLYFKKHGFKRPANMHNRVIHKRVRKERSNEKIVQSVVNEIINTIMMQRP